MPRVFLRFRTIERARNRVEQHALRAAERSDGLKASLPNPVVDGSPGNPQKCCRMVKRNAATDAVAHSQVWFLFQRRHPVCPNADIKGTDGASMRWPVHGLLNSFQNNHLAIQSENRFQPFGQPLPAKKLTAARTAAEFCQ